MPVPVIMPKLEMSQETATLIEWLKQEGESVEKGEPLLTVETDKLTMDIESPGSGVLAGVTAKAGDVVPVTNVIAYLLQPGETLPSSPAATVPAPAEVKPVLTPEAHEKAVVGATPLARRIAQVEGVDLQQISGSGPTGQITKDDVVSAITGEKHSLKPSKETHASGGKVRATPAARRAARLRSIDLYDIQGSGPDGRIQEKDVTQYSPAALAASLPGSESDIVPFAGMRRKIAERMQASYQTAPHITFTARVDLTNLEKVLAMMNEKAGALNAHRITMTAIIIKITAWALRQHPWLNSSLRGEEIHIFKDINIGVAVALPEGLIVPVVKQADLKGTAQIAVEVNDISQRARANQLLPADVAGGTFTISNLGPFGIEQFTAIINPGQAAILAVGAAQQEMLVVDGQPQVRPVLRMTLSADHRLVDGAVAARFIADLRRALEEPAMLLW